MTSAAIRKFDELIRCTSVLTDGIENGKSNQFLLVQRLKHYLVRSHPQMHLVRDSGFFPLFSEPPPPAPPPSLADLAKTFLVSSSNTEYEKCLHAKV